MTGCDSTSGFAWKGKKTGLDIIIENKELQEVADVFNSQDSSEDDLNIGAEKFIHVLYKGNIGQSLEEIRYNKFESLASQSKLSIAERLSKLPQTKSALHQHAKRVYYQVQRWRGNDMDPTKWGWKRAGMLLIPVMSTDPPAAEEFLRQVMTADSKYIQ